MIQMSAQLKSLLSDQVHRWATCWSIARQDGTTLYFTDHNADLIVDGNTYLGSTGFKPSARQKLSDLSVANLEVNGIIDAAIVTDADLRSGRYRNAEVTEKLVDWRYPWAGTFVENHYWIGEVKLTRSGWVGQMSGLSKWLAPSIGKVYTRNCPARLGDNKCTKDLTTFTFTGTVSSVTSANNFTTGLTQADEYFQYGRLKWTSGANNKFQLDVKHYYHSGGQVITWLSSPFVPSPGDAFTIVAGCDHTIQTCINKFNNFVNFQGYPYIPGTDLQYLTPDVKT